MPRVLFPLFLWILAASTAFGARSSPQKLTPVGNGLAFVATTPEDGTELWFTDGTRAGTIRLLPSGGGDEREFVFRLDKKKMRSVR